MLPSTFLLYKLNTSEYKCSLQVCWPELVFGALLYLHQKTSRWPALEQPKSPSLLHAILIFCMQESLPFPQISDFQQVLEETE